MKTSILFLLTIFTASYLKGQVVDNHLNIGVGYDYVTSLNSDNISHVDHLNYPSLYGNYNYIHAGEIYADFRVQKNFWIGIHFDKFKYNNWSGNKDVFILQDPVLAFSTVSASLIYNLNSARSANNLTHFNIFLAPLIGSQHLSWSAIQQSAYSDSVYAGGEHQTDPGFRAGFGISHDINNDMGISANIFYQYIHVNSYYYLDHSFSSVDVSVKLYIRFLKNRYYRYD